MRLLLTPIIIRFLFLDLAHDFYEAGYENVTCIDYCESVIERMKAGEAEQCPNIQCLPGSIFSMFISLLGLCMDALNISFEAESFNFIVDKGLSLLLIME